MFGERVAMMKGLSRAKVPNSSAFVSWAGNWIDENAPLHDGAGLFGDFERGVERFYVLGSGFVHGLKWAADYVKGELNTFGMVADGLAAAVGMAECAVALFEAQAQAVATNRRQSYPELLEPTILKWSEMYA